MIKKHTLGIGIVSIVLSTNVFNVNANTQGVVNTSSLNVRTGPGTNYSVLFKLSKNSTVTILETKQNWYKINYNGKQGWVNGSYINIKNNTSTPSTSIVKMATTNVNMRSGAGTNYKILVSVLKGKTVTVISSSNGWDKVNYNGKVGYINNKYLKTVTSSSDSNNNSNNSSQTTTSYKVISETLNIRSGASTSYSIIGKVNKNNTVNVVSITNGWAKITYSNGYAYCSANYLEKVTASTGSSQISNDITFEYKLDNNKDSFIITSKSKVAYNSFYLSNPSRLVIDIENTKIPASIPDENIDKTYIKTYRASYNKDSNSTRLVIEFLKDFDTNNIKITQVDNKIQVLFDKDTTNNSPENSTSPSPTINKLNISYNLDNNKDSLIITSSTKVNYKNYYTSNPSKLIMELKDTQVEDNIIEEILDKTYIKKYNSKYDKESNTTKLEIEFLESFNHDDIKIIQTDNKLQILFDKDINLSKPTTPNEPSNPSEIINKLDFEYKLNNNKDSFIIKSTKEVSYNSFYLESPNRLVLDFNNSKIDRNISDININKTYIKTYRAHYYEDTNSTRLVLVFTDTFNKDNIKISKNNNEIEILFDKDIPSQSLDNPLLSNPAWNKTYVNKTLEEFVNIQSAKYAVISSSKGFIRATKEEIYEHLNPNAELLNDRNYKFQFLRIDKYREVNLKKLNDYLNSLSIPTSKKNVFKDKGQAFIDATKKYNVDPLYFLAHTILETGSGTSALAQGHEVVLDKNGKAIIDSEGYVVLKNEDTPEDAKTVTVYNLFGIGATDNNAIRGGTTKAYNEGWFTIDKAIEGGCKWISNNYINSTKYYHQNTLYSIRWDYVNEWHQYSTDVAWALKISKNINALSYIYTNGNNDLNFSFPVYK